MNKLKANHSPANYYAYKLLAVLAPAFAYLIITTGYQIVGWSIHDPTLMGNVWVLKPHILVLRDLKVDQWLEE